MRVVLAAAAMLAALGVAGTAQAQSQPGLEGRVDRLEREMRAVQRKVFPGGAGQTFEPQITPEQDSSVPGTPATSPVADLTQRVAAVEGQLQTLTGQVEQDQYRIRQLEDAFGAYKRSTDARLKALEDGAAAVAPPRETSTTVSDDTLDVPAPPPARPARPGSKPAAADAGIKPPPVVATVPAADKPATKPAGTGTRAERLAAIERPATDDPAEDGYVYGYRLWQAKFYPESRKEFEQVVAKYPKHRRASYAQNLLGRAYLDAGAPSLAAVAFYENFKKNPNGERAPDSLYYLAQALGQLKKPASEICKVYGELTTVYGDHISPEMQKGVDDGRAKYKCT